MDGRLQVPDSVLLVGKIHFAQLVGLDLDLLGMLAAWGSVYHVLVACVDV